MIFFMEKIADLFKVNIKYDIINVTEFHKWNVRSVILSTKGDEL